MQYKIYSVSGPSWQPIKDGKEYNKWVGTVRLIPNVQGGGLFMRTMTVVGATEAAVNNKLNHYRFTQFTNLDESKLDPIAKIKKEGSNANANR